jgi:branched-chain amino acid transport system permease protein
MVLNFFANALVVSSMYALVAIGLTLIYSVGGIFNLAHGVNVAVGAWLTWYLVAELGLSIWIGIGAAMIVPALFSLAIYWGMIRRIESAPIIIMTVTLLIEIISEYFIRSAIGTQVRAVPQVLTGSVTIAGTDIQANYVLAFVLSWVLIAAVFLFINRTKFGKALIATSMSEKGPALVGINKGRIHAVTWLVAGMLAGLAGLFFGSYQGASWLIGQSALFIAFPIVVLGGIGSIKGSVLAAYIIGFLEIGVVTYYDPSLSGILPFLLLIAILLGRPQGLLGRAQEV